MSTDAEDNVNRQMNIAQQNTNTPAFYFFSKT